MKQENSKSWLWAFVAKQFSVFQIRPTRASGILEDLLTDKFSGIVTCDRAKRYWKLNQLQWCWAHLKRAHKKNTGKRWLTVRSISSKNLARIC
ncbi:MAG: transposase [Planctomycetaceae bacterium]|nr:transposase [Planctomycetaceae bacterium]